LERQERMLLRKIRADHKERLAIVQIASCRQSVLLAAERVQKRRQIAGAMVIDVIRTQHLASKLLQEVIFFVGRVIRPDDAKLPTPVARFFKPPPNNL